MEGLATTGVAYHREDMWHMALRDGGVFWMSWELLIASITVFVAFLFLGYPIIHAPGRAKLLPMLPSNSRFSCQCDR